MIVPSENQCLIKLKLFDRPLIQVHQPCFGTSLSPVDSCSKHCWIVILIFLLKSQAILSSFTTLLFQLTSALTFDSIRFDPSLFLSKFYQVALYECLFDWTDIRVPDCHINIAYTFTRAIGWANRTFAYPL